MSSAARRVFCSSTVERVLVRSRVGREGISDSCCVSLSDSETVSTVDDAMWDWWRLDLGRGFMRGWGSVIEDMNVPDLERGLGVDDFEVGLRADLGEESTFTLALSFFLMLALMSPLETDMLRLRLRP